MADAQKFVLSDVLTEVREKHPDIVIDLGDADPVSFPDPRLWGREITELGDDNEAVIKKLLGDDGYERFMDAGGTLGVFQEIIERSTGVSLGESSTS